MNGAANCIVYFVQVQVHTVICVNEQADSFQKVRAQNDINDNYQVILFYSVTLLIYALILAGSFRTVSHRTTKAKN